MLNYLKVKVLNLADEAKLIRREEQQRAWKRDMALQQDRDDRAGYHEKVRNGLHQHRITIVRDEARNSQLAYGLLKGRAYYEIERFAKVAPDWDKIKRIAMRFHEAEEPGLMELYVNEWIKEAKEDFVHNYCTRMANKRYLTMNGTQAVNDAIVS